MCNLTLMSTAWVWLYGTYLGASLIINQSIYTRILIQGGSVISAGVVLESRWFSVWTMVTLIIGEPTRICVASSKPIQ